MGRPVVAQMPMVKCIVGGKDLGEQLLDFEWMARANGGYVVRMKTVDQHLNFLKDWAKDELLPKARKEPLEMKFQIKWPKQGETKERKAWITDVASEGTFIVNETEIIAIDPPSWALNAGNSAGKVYRGNVSDVIKQVCNDYQIKGAPNLTKITETGDDKNNQWWMMRQDPKTFIQMLLDWSSKLTPKKTNWSTSTKDYEMHIVEQADIPNLNFGIYDIDVRKITAASDMQHISIHSDVLTNFWQTKLVTQGISAVSGKYYDKIATEPDVVVTDERTGNKIDAASTSEESFKKPTEDWSTSLLAIPEHNAGDVGVEYGGYIDGRARNMYISQLNLMHRIRLLVRGDPVIDDPFGLDGTVVNLRWKNEYGNPYWLGGKWIVYGFHHIVTRAMWWTALYLRRYDYNSAATKR
ncbi:MAG: hypothetical protein Q8K86_08315 [Candidatus Nanopelagicaceae bacterium]|nr:hypothetical protein [Candidatus Nanopelagicaceae bacterium]